MSVKVILEISCPSCGSRDIRRSRRTGWHRAVVGARLRYMAISASPVLMPEASMHKDHALSRAEHDIGTTGQHSIMQSESIAEPMQQTSYHHLRRGVVPADSTHHRAPFFSRH